MTLTRKTPITRSPMQRTSRPVGILSQASHQKLAKQRTRKCAVKGCRAEFMPDRPFVRWCSPECGVVVAIGLAAARKAKAARAERAETKRKLDGFKSIPQLKAELQDIFNLFIRLRDADLGCICCGKWPKGGEALSGGQWDAAHW